MLRVAGAIASLLCACAVLGDELPAPLVITDFDTFEVAADRGVLALASRSRTADERLVAAVREQLLGRGYDARSSIRRDEIVDPVVLEQLALAETAAEAQVAFRRARGRIVRADGFVWSVGPGLDALDAGTGARTVLLITGYRYRPTANRVLSQVLLTVAAFSLRPPLYVVPGVSMSSRAIACLVDAKSGAILWSEAIYGSGAEPDRDDDAKELVGRLLDSFPVANTVAGGPK